MRLVAALATALALFSADANAARAGQIDYLIQFNNGADRAGDAVTAGHRNAEDASPIQSHSMLVEVTRISTGNPVPGTFVLISSARELPDINGHAKLYLALDRDKCTRSTVGCVIVSHAGGGVLQDIQFTPLYMGAKYTFGNLQ